MDEDLAREGRQRALLQRALDQYREGRLTLRVLAESLYALAEEINSASEDWIEELQAEANGLEAIYAIALDRGIAENLPEGSRRDVDEAIDRIETMLADLT